LTSLYLYPGGNKTSTARIFRLYWIGFVNGLYGNSQEPLKVRP